MATTSIPSCCRAARRTRRPMRPNPLIPTRAGLTAIELAKGLWQAHLQQKEKDLCSCAYMAVMQPMICRYR